MNINGISSSSSNIVSSQPLPEGQEKEAVSQDISSTVESVPQTKVNLSDAIKSALTEITKNISQRETLLQSLPADIKEAVLKLLQDNTIDTDAFAKGFVNLLASQRQSIEKLLNLSQILSGAALYQNEGELTSNLEEALLLLGNNLQAETQEPEILAQRSQSALQAKMLPQAELSALKDIGSLSEQVMSADTPEAEKQLIMTAKQAISQLLGNKNLQIPLKEMAALNQLLNSFEQKMPASILQTAVQYQMPEVLDAYVLLNLQEALQQKALPSLTVSISSNQANNEQIAQPEENLSSVLADDKFPTDAKSLETSVQINMEQKVKATAQRATITLAGQLLDTNSDDGQEQTIIEAKQLLSQVFSGKDIQIPAQSLGNVRQLFKNLQQNLPQAVQLAAEKYEFPELADAFAALALYDTMDQQKPSLLSNILNLTPKKETAAQQESGQTSLNSPGNLILAAEDDLKSLFATKSWNSNDVNLLAERMLATQGMPEAENMQATIKEVLQQLLASKDTQMLEKEMSNFNKLFNSLNQKIPQSVQQAATMFQMPEMLDVYVLLKLKDIMQWKEISPKLLQQSSDTLRDLAVVMQKDINANTGEITAKQLIASFNMPIYFEGNGNPYPLYIHIYSDKEKNQSVAYRGNEVWMRCSLVTDNIGTVDVLLHLYGESQLSVKVNFSCDQYANDFLDYVPDIRANMDNLPVNLAELRVTGDR